MAPENIRKEERGVDVAMCRAPKGCNAATNIFQEKCHKVCSCALLLFEFELFMVYSWRDFPSLLVLGVLRAEVGPLTTCRSPRPASDEALLSLVATRRPICVFPWEYEGGRN